MSNQFTYEEAATVLENFQTWWTQNTYERREMGVEPMRQPEAVEAFCTQNNVDPNTIEAAYSAVIEDVTLNR